MAQTTPRQAYQAGDAQTNHGGLPAKMDESNEAWSVSLNKPLITAVAAGAIGVAIGVLVMRSRRPNRYATVERAVELARSGTITTFQKLRRRLREEGYSLGQIESQAKKQLRRLISAASSR